MSLDPLAANAQLHYEPADHSWVTVNGDAPFYARAVQNLGQLKLPVYDQIVATNYVATDKPQNITLKLNNVTVATITITYDGSNNLQNLSTTIV